MNQITQMFTESNDRMKHIMNGKYKQDQIAAAQREFEGQIKLINAVVSAYAISSKNRRALAGLAKMNIMDDSEAILFNDCPPENENIKCPDLGIITRQDCLDRSGSKEHYETCHGCETRSETRKKCELVGGEAAFLYDIKDLA